MAQKNPLTKISSGDLKWLNFKWRSGQDRVGGAVYAGQEQGQEQSLLYALVSVGGFKELLQGVSAAIQAAHAQANGRDVFADGHVAVGGAAMEEDGLISQIAADGIGGFHNGRMDILSTGRHIAITLVGHGDSVLAPTGSLFILSLIHIWAERCFEQMIDRQVDSPFFPAEAG